VLPRESRYSRPERRAQRRTDLTALETLEERTLLSFTTLGYSLPDLTITGEAGQRAAWGGTLGVSVYLQNIGASSTTEPLNQLPPTQSQAAGSLYGSTSSADVPDSTVKVLLTRSSKSLAGAVTLGTFEAPPLSQNNLEQQQASFTLPSRPRGFAGAGGTFYVWFVANSTDAFLESNYANNISKPVAVQVAPSPLPELRAIGLSIPSNLQPGDTIDPVITIENIGTADTDSQGPVTVELVASVTRSFTLGSSVVAKYTVSNIPAVSEAPTRAKYRTFASQILPAPANVITIAGTAVTLPTSPGNYYLGVVIDPDNDIKQLKRPANAFEVIHVVGPARKTLSASGVVSTGNTGQFPVAPSGESVGVN
jgi:hypothetical protein